MSLISERTKWVLFLSSPHPNPEFRHVIDLVFGFLCLEKAGVNHQDIFIYIDGNPQVISQYFVIGTSSPLQIKNSDEFFTDASQNDYSQMVMFVTGHGSPHGIDAAVPINPNKLITTIKSMPQLSDAVVYLGQCYAGLFNYVKAGRPYGTTEPDVILIGATNLHESLSHSTSEKFMTQEVTWPANLFLLHVFKWISSPVDVDGDGKVTIMDSFKYAGVHSNMHNKQFKTGGFMGMLNLHEQCKSLFSLCQSQKDDQALNMNNMVTFEAAMTQYQDCLSAHYVHQESWILNSIPAQKIEF